MTRSRKKCQMKKEEEREKGKIWKEEKNIKTHPHKKKKGLAERGTGSGRAVHDGGRKLKGKEVWLSVECLLENMVQV